MMLNDTDIISTNDMQLRQEQQSAKILNHMFHTIDKTGLSQADLDAIAIWLLTGATKAARRNQSHVTWRWSFVQRQIESILMMELYPDSSDFKKLYQIFEQICDNHDLAIAEINDSITISWDE